MTPATYPAADRPMVIVPGLLSLLTVLLLLVAADGSSAVHFVVRAFLVLVVPSALGVWWWRRVRARPSLASSATLHGGFAALLLGFAVPYGVDAGWRPGGFPSAVFATVLGGFAVAGAEGVAWLGRWIEARRRAV